MPRVRQGSQAVDVDHLQVFGRGLKDVFVVMGLRGFSPVCGWAPGRRDQRWLEGFAEVCEGMTSRGRSHPGLLPLANRWFEVSRLLPAVSSDPDVAAAPRALERKLLAHPGHHAGPGGLSAPARADSVGGFVSGKPVVDFGYAAVWATDYGESLQREGGRAQYPSKCSRLRN